jgi:peroxiredoxin
MALNRRAAAFILAASMLVVPVPSASPAMAAPAAQVETAPAAGPAPGDLVPPFEAEALDGTRRSFNYPKGSSTVLLFFLSSCPTCHRMIPEWNRAFERKPAGLNVIGVLMDREPPGFFQLLPVAFPIVRAPGRDFLKAYKVTRTPITIRIGAGGRVEEAAVGIIDPIRLGQIFRR